jgi:hypothetical protein
MLEQGTKAEKVQMKNEEKTKKSNEAFATRESYEVEKKRTKERREVCNAEN